MISYTPNLLEDFSFEFWAVIPPYYEDYSQYIQKFGCEIKKISDEDGESAEIVGKLFGYRLLLQDAYYDEEESLHDILDVEGQLFDLYKVLFDDFSSIKKKYYKAFQINFAEEVPNFILLDRMEVLHAYRGMNIGKAAISNAIHLYGKMSDIVILKSFPLQHEGSIKDRNHTDSWKKAMKFEELEKNPELSKKALSAYYKKLGFKTLRGTEYMYHILPY